MGRSPQPRCRRPAAWRQLALVCAVTVLVGSCSTGATSVTSSSAALRATGSSATVSTSGTEASASSVVERYSTSKFQVPLDVDTPTWLQGPPTIEGTTYLTWATSPDEDPAVRFLVPTTLIQPGAAEATPAPDGYLEYLRGLVPAGVILEDEEDITIGGLPATIVTVTSSKDLEGALGCTGPDVGDDCLGYLIELRLRMAILNVGANTLLIWGRSYRDSPEIATNDESLDLMLASVEFRDAATTSSPTS